MKTTNHPCSRWSIAVLMNGTSYPLEEDDEFQREFVVHGDGEYADDEIHINTCKSHGSLLRP